MERYFQLSEETIQEFNLVYNKYALPIPIKFQFIGDEKQKTLVTISKIPNEYSFLLGKELKVTINEDMMNVFDEESINILFEQEIARISVDMDKGKIKLVKPDIVTFASILNKHGVDKVARANKVEELYQDQKNDSLSDDFIENKII